VNSSIFGRAKGGAKNEKATRDAVWVENAHYAFVAHERGEEGLIVGGTSSRFEKLALDGIATSEVRVALLLLVERERKTPGRS
jgi:hypothetical protein